MRRLETKCGSSKDTPIGPALASLAKSKGLDCVAAKEWFEHGYQEKWLELPGGRLGTKPGNFLAIEDVPSDTAKKVDFQVMGNGLQKEDLVLVHKDTFHRLAAHFRLALSLESACMLAGTGTGHCASTVR